MRPPSDIKWVRNLESALHWFGNTFIASPSEKMYAFKKTFFTTAIGFAVLRSLYAGFSSHAEHKVHLGTLAWHSALVGLAAYPVTLIPMWGEWPNWDLRQWFSQPDPGWRANPNGG